MKEQLLETWHIHQRMNLLLLESISEEGLEKTLSKRGRTIYQQWVHIHNVRLGWLEVSAPAIYKKYKKLDKEENIDKRKLIQCLNESSKGIEELLSISWDNGGKVKGFKSVITMLGYFISHESHHRGNIMLTLKQCGEKIPDAVKWGIWEWGK